MIFTIEKIFFGFVLQIIFINLYAQNGLKIDSITKVNIEEITVTASKINSLSKDVAGKVDIISKYQIDNLPAQKIDDLLRYTSGVTVNRANGNYTMRPVVTLRNLGGDEQSRTLVLFNGVPVNSSDEGGVNWNRINLNTIEKVEVFKGSGSSLYGNNAMGGVINIITRQPVKPFEAVFGMGYGTYNTFKPEFYLGGAVKNKLIWSLFGFYQKSDGYNTVPKSKPEYIYSVPRFLKEGGLTSNIEYKINDLLNIGIQYDIYRDKRGEGERIQATDGEYRNFNTNFSNLKVFGKKKKFEYQINLFFQRERYFRIDERIKNSIYSRFDVKSVRDDYGICANTNYILTPNHLILIGMEYKVGSIDGGDYYKTSDDRVLNKGTLSSSAIYILNELKLFSEKVSITGGLRFDNVRFYNGNYEATGINVDYWTNYTPNLTSHSWNAISPRLAVRYHFAGNISAYVSYSRGYRASILDDLCRSGWMWVGPKIANPDLGPEYLDNFEVGLRFVLFKKLIIEPTAYYSVGSDFLYYVATGDSISKRPVHRRENISKANFKGTEIDIHYNFNSNITVWTNYTFATSKILQFSKKKELEGKAFKYAPNHKFNLGLICTNKYLNISLSGFYKDKQFITDDNSTGINGYFTFDMQISRGFYKNKVKASLSIMDLFNNKHMETADYLSPGRLITIKLNFEICKVNW